MRSPTGRWGRANYPVFERTSIRRRSSLCFERSDPSRYFCANAQPPRNRSLFRAFGRSRGAQRRGWKGSLDRGRPRGFHRSSEQHKARIQKSIAASGHSIDHHNIEAWTFLPGNRKTGYSRGKNESASSGRAQALFGNSGPLRLLVGDARGERGSWHLCFLAVMDTRIPSFPRGSTLTSNVSPGSQTILLPLGLFLYSRKPNYHAPRPHTLGQMSRCRP